MIRCDLLGPDGDGTEISAVSKTNANRMILRGGALTSILKIEGARKPAGLEQKGQWVASATPNYESSFHVVWMQKQGKENTEAPKGKNAPALIENAAHGLFEKAASGSTWLSVVTSSAETDARARQARHEAVLERIANNPWLALRRLNAEQYLKLMVAFTETRPAHTKIWDPHNNPGMWFQPGRTDNCLLLGSWWWAPVCMTQGPAEHRPWDEFTPPKTPCWLSFRVSGDAQKRFQMRSSAAGWLANAGNQRIAQASNLLYSLPRKEACSVSIAGLAGGETPADARAAAAETAAQLEAWLGGRVSLQASAMSVLSLCVPGFVGSGGRQPPFWPATNAQAAALLPLVQPASPWRDATPVQPVPFVKTAAAMQTIAGGEASRGFPFNPFGEQPTYSTLIAGESGSGKSMALSHIAMEFANKHPGAPLRMLDAGRSAEPLGELWKQQAHAVAQPDLRVIPPVNVLLPPFPLMSGGPLQVAGVLALTGALAKDFSGRRPKLVEKALKLAWGMARSGTLEGKDPKAIEDCMKRGDMQGAREAHAAAAPTLHNLALLFATPALARVDRGDADAKWLNETITEACGNYPNLVVESPPKWLAANRMIAELGGQALMDDPMTPIRYTMGLSLLTGDLAPTDWNIDSAPGEQSLELARENARKCASEPKLVICDEMHRLKNNATANTWLERIAREGRKAYLGMILASQRAEDFAPGVIAQASVLMAFSSETSAPEHFGVWPANMNSGAGNAAIRAKSNSGLEYQAAVRLQLPPEQLWALGSGARERALTKELTQKIGYAKALRELANRLPGGTLPPDAPPATDIVSAWIKGK